jgi:hypothetical protein
VFFGFLAGWIVGWGWAVWGCFLCRFMRFFSSVGKSRSKGHYARPFFRVAARSVIHPQRL